MGKLEIGLEKLNIEKLKNLLVGSVKMLSDKNSENELFKEFLDLAESKKIGEKKFRILENE